MQTHALEKVFLVPWRYFCLGSLDTWTHADACFGKGFSCPMEVFLSRIIGHMDTCRRMLWKRFFLSHGGIFVSDHWTHGHMQTHALEKVFLVPWRYFCLGSLDTWTH